MYNTFTICCRKWYSSCYSILFFVEIDAIQAGKQAEKERKKREKTKVVGDLHPMLNALPTLEELIANASKQQTSTKKGTGLKKQKEAKKEL